MPRITLNAAINEYLEHRELDKALAKNTLRGDVATLRSFERQVGNPYVDKLDEKHIRLYLRDRLRLTADSYNNHITRLAAFLTYCRKRGYIHPYTDLLIHVSRRKAVAREFWRVDVQDFPYLIDATESERNRAIVATGLYLFLRGGEVRSLNVSDLNLNEGTMRVTIHKGGGWVDPMPISQELDAELRNWMTVYAKSIDGPIHPDWPLFPGHRAKFIVGERYSQEMYLDPARRATRLERIAQHSLESLGYDVRNPDGTSKYEGFHTLRRSGARGLFDSLVDQSYDGALRVVQAMLHHAQSTTTERYLGLGLDRHKRDSVVSGRRMFPTATPANVLPLRGVGNG